MTFETSAQEECYRRVTDWLERVRYRIEADPDEPVLTVRAGSSVVRLRVYPWGKADATIRIRAQVVIGAPLDPELTEFLLRENARLQFGGFGLDGDGDIVFEHSLVGSTCDVDEILSALAAVSMAADAYDNRIVERWGGRRAIDLDD